MLKPALLSFLVGAGCAARAPAPAPAPDRPPMATADRCPMHVVGTTVAGADSVTGEDIAFTTSGDIDGLRSRVHEMAAMHGKMAGGDHASGGMKDMAMMKDMPMMPSSHAVVADTAAGATIALTPDDPAQLGALRTAARHHVEMMQGGDCPMMHAMTPVAAGE
ncbi:MAG: hypothetical protein K8W52_07345 [Deltaproteobacteria bacterium]|nr:hypothetical protein [Deltaproteobacteria bacterium]